jgi:hypothetical protein
MEENEVAGGISLKRTLVPWPLPVFLGLLASMRYVTLLYHILHTMFHLTTDPEITVASDCGLKL